MKRLGAGQRLNDELPSGRWIDLPALLTSPSPGREATARGDSAVRSDGLRQRLRSLSRTFGIGRLRARAVPLRGLNSSHHRLPARGGISRCGHRSHHRTLVAAPARSASRLHLDVLFRVEHLGGGRPEGDFARIRRSFSGRRRRGDAAAPLRQSFPQSLLVTRSEAGRLREAAARTSICFLAECGVHASAWIRRCAQRPLLVLTLTRRVRAASCWSEMAATRQRPNTRT